ncbi:purine-cytosine permease family protein [Paraglaciecola sp.]|uniref:purine-cytosine permease family protein n=1 Tax=Paraglaciecola sp. TaxID=1920173 RepID=UPI003EF2633D
MSSQSEYSAEPIAKEQLLPWPRVAAVSAMVAFSLPTFISGLEVYQGLSVPDTLMAILIGSLLLTLIGATMGAIGAKTRMSSYLLVRIAFGDKGAGVVNIAFALSLIGWFGVNIDLFASAVSRLIEDSFAMSIPHWMIEVAAGICMVTTTIFGFKAINVIASIMVPILAIVTGVMYWAASSQLDFVDYWNVQKGVTLSLSDGVGAIVGGIIIGAIILPDITRFSRHWRGGAYTAFWSYMVVELIVLVVAGFAAAASGETEILSLMLGLGLGFAAFTIVIAGSWVLNSLNLYSTMLSVEATFPKVKGNLYICLFGLIGVIAAFFNILDFFITFLVFLSAIFIPVAGVIIVDFLVIKKHAYTVSNLSKNIQFSLPAFVAWLVGSGIAVFDNSSVIPSITSITALDAVIVTGLLYGILAKLFPKNVGSNL